MNRRNFLAASALSITAFGCSKPESAKSTLGIEEPKKPNIIFVMADDLGFGDLGCYGQEVIRTPNLDQFASEGMRFTEHYAGSTVCAPSRCCLMTGVHTGHAYVRGNKEIQPMGQLPLTSDTLTVGRLLQDAGYTTALIGKWGLGGPDSSGHPNRQGFDHFFGYLCQRHAHNYYPEFLFRNESRVPLEGNKIDEPRPDGAGHSSEKSTYSADLILDEALSFLEDNKENPFFLYFASTLPHANNEAGNEGMEIPSFGEYADSDWPDAQKGHAAMISYLDSAVGKVLDKLKTLGLDENTLVIFTSDNGPHREGGADPEFFASSGPLRGIKRDLYEGGIRVPMMARWPGKISPGSESDHISAFWDLLPTCADLAGVTIKSTIDGISYLPELLGDEQLSHEYLYWEFKTMQGVRKQNWKAIRSEPESEIELFDLESDLEESTDISGDHLEVVEELKKIMDSAHSPSEYFPLYPGESA